MPLKEGDRVRIKVRELNDDDRHLHSLYDHMLGLTGTVENYYNKDEIAIKVDEDALTGEPKKVHTEATRRLRARLKENLSEEHRKMLTPEEQKFTPNYVLLVREQDLEQI